MFQIGDIVKRVYPSGSWKVMEIKEIDSNGDYSGILLDASDTRYIGKWWNFFYCQGWVAAEMQLYNPSKHKRVETKFLGGLNELL